MRLYELWQNNHRPVYGCIGCMENETRHETSSCDAYRSIGWSQIVDRLVSTDLISSWDFCPGLCPGIIGYSPWHQFTLGANQAGSGETGWLIARCENSWIGCRNYLQKEQRELQKTEHPWNCLWDFAFSHTYIRTNPQQVLAKSRGATTVGPAKSMGI